MSLPLIHDTAHSNRNDAPKTGFLDLPVEIRLMIYELLPVRTRHAHILHMLSYEQGSDMTPLPPDGGTIQLVIKSVPSAILSTCKLIYREAYPIFQAQISKLRTDRPRMIVHLKALTNRSLFIGILNAISTWMATLQRNALDLTFPQLDEAFKDLMNEWGFFEFSQLNSTDLKDVFTFIRKSAHQLVHLSDPSPSVRKSRQFLEILVVGSENHSTMNTVTKDLGWKACMLRYGIRVTEFGEKQTQPILFSYSTARTVANAFGSYSDFWRRPTHADEDLGDVDMEVKYLGQAWTDKRYRTTSKWYGGPTSREEWKANWAESVVYL